MGRIVAIDYGEKRIGLAMTEETGSIALPFQAIDSGDSIEQSSQNILKALQPFLKKIDTFILGLPLLLSGKKGSIAKKVEELKKHLEEKTPIPIVLWDERLTSSQAHTELKKLRLSRKKRTKKIDPVAATLLLQSYLEFLTHSKKKDFPSK